MMRFLKKVHKWVALLIGIQVLLWLVSGLMMSLLNPEKVSGQKWAREAAHQVEALPAGTLLEPGDLPVEQTTGAQLIRLMMHKGQPVYRISRNGSTVLIDATNGTVITYDKNAAVKLASDDYLGDGQIRLIERGIAPDMETRNHRGDYWLIDFSDGVETSLYVSTSTGAILERRNNYWRVFDVFWMLHIMDYSERSNFNNTLIIVVALIAIWLGLSGFLLLFGSFERSDFYFWRKTKRPNDVLVTLIDPAISTPQQVRLKHGGNLFLSLAANNVTLPTNCGGGGSCGLCRVQMESTELAAPNSSEKKLIAPHLLNDGYRLACQQKVDHSITLRLAEGTIAAELITATVKTARMVTPTIREITLECEQPLIYAAGSFFLLNIPAHDGSATPTQRAYSAVNYAGETDRCLILNVRLQPPPAAKPGVGSGVASSWLHAVSPGDGVTLSGPHGHFHAQDTQREMVFIGGGAGMGPLRAIILDQLVDKNSPRRISYWYGARHNGELYYVDTFDQLARDFENFSWNVVLSEPDTAANQQSEAWEGPTGFVHQAALDGYLAGHADIGNCEFYICGPPAMLMATLEMLSELGVKSDAIRYDDFGS